MTEDELRELAGIDPAPQVEFLGEMFKIRQDGLAALLRFAGGSLSEDAEQGLALPVIHRFLEDCLIDWDAFQAKAIGARAGLNDIFPAVKQIVTWHCGRGYWPALRLIGFLAGNMAEVDGQLIRSGHGGVAALSAREACDVVLAICLEGRPADEREFFMEDLEYEGNPEADALAQLRAFQAQQKEAAGG